MIFLIIQVEPKKARFLTTGKLGLGTTSPSAWFKIAPSGSNESFSTTSSGTGIADAWTMFRGSQEMARLYFGASANAFILQSSRGAFHITTGSAGTPSTTTDCAEFIGGTGSDRGWLGLGDWHVFSAKTNLHIHTNASSNTGIQLSNLTTGSTSTDGFRLVSDNTGNVTMSNFEEYKKISFATTVVGGGSVADRLVIDDGNNYGRVGIGGPASAQLQVLDNTDLTISGDDIGFILEERLQSSNTTNRGVGARINVENGTGNVGIECVVDNTSSNTNIDMVGVFSRLRHTNTSNTQYARNFYAYNDADCKATNKYGFIAVMSGSNSTNTYGGYFDANSSAGNNFGVYASAPSQCTGTSPTITCSGAAGYFAGDMYASGLYGSSDLQLKDQINTVSNANSILSLMECKRFVYKTQAYPQMNLPQGNHYGFIAQDVEAILPGLVRNFTQPAIYDSIGQVITPEVGFKAVNYVEFVPLLVAAVKEQKATIDSLLNTLQNPTPIVNPQNKQSVTLSNVSSIILNQNDPNPFTESTRITYQVPEDVREAKIIFTNSSGSIINTVIVNERGTGELEVYSSDLSKGIYNYTLICDGKVIATKKMVKQ